MIMVAIHVDMQNNKIRKLSYEVNIALGYYMDMNFILSIKHARNIDRKKKTIQSSSSDISVQRCFLF